MQRPPYGWIRRSGAPSAASKSAVLPIVDVVPARLDWFEALVAGDDTFIERFGIPVVEGWEGFPEALPHALEGVRHAPEDPWGAHLFLDPADGALVGFRWLRRPAARWSWDPPWRRPGRVVASPLRRWELSLT